MAQKIPKAPRDKRFQIDRHGSSDLFMHHSTVGKKKDAEKIAMRLRNMGHQIRVTKARRKGKNWYDIWER